MSSPQLQSMASCALAASHLRRIHPDAGVLTSVTRKERKLFRARLVTKEEMIWIFGPKGQLQKEGDYAIDAGGAIYQFVEGVWHRYTDWLAPSGAFYIAFWHCCKQAT